MARYTVSVQDKEYDVTVEYRSGRFTVTLDGQELSVDHKALAGSRALMLVDHQSHEVDVRYNGSDTERIVFLSGTEIPLAIEDYNLAQLRKSAGQAVAGVAERALTAPMPGLIVDIKVVEGETVKKGQPLVVIEAMKMENILKARTDAVVKAVVVSGGQSVEKGEKILEFE